MIRHMTDYQNACERTWLPRPVDEYVSLMFGRRVVSSEVPAYPVPELGFFPDPGIEVLVGQLDQLNSARVEAIARYGVGTKSVILEYVRLNPNEAMNVLRILEGDQTSQAKLVFFFKKVKGILVALRPLVVALSPPEVSSRTALTGSDKQAAEVAFDNRLHHAKKVVAAKLARLELEKAQAKALSCAIMAALDKKKDIIEGRVVLPDLNAARPFPGVVDEAGISQVLNFLPRKLRDHPALVVASRPTPTWDDDTQRLLRPLDAVDTAGLTGLDRNPDGARQRSRSRHRGRSRSRDRRNRDRSGRSGQRGRDLRRRLDDNRTRDQHQRSRSRDLRHRIDRSRERADRRADYSSARDNRRSRSPGGYRRRASGSPAPSEYSEVGNRHPYRFPNLTGRSPLPRRHLSPVPSERSYWEDQASTDNQMRSRSSGGYQHGASGSSDVFSYDEQQQDYPVRNPAPRRPLRDYDDPDRRRHDSGFQSEGRRSPSRYSERPGSAIQVGDEIYPTESVRRPHPVLQTGDEIYDRQLREDEIRREEQYRPGRRDRRDAPEYF
jgi:hypothetical protein